MKKRDKEKWVKALRSGKYKQARNALKVKQDDGSVGYCCLGVACEVFGVGKKALRMTGQVYDDKSERYLPCSYGFEGLGADKQFLGPATCKKLGIAEEQQEELAQMNDSGKTFNQIANYIEKKL